MYSRFGRLVGLLFWGVTAFIKFGVKLNNNLTKKQHEKPNELRIKAKRKDYNTFAARPDPE
jgi:hypothetical protein